jgi:hypothetical protein
MNLFEENNRFRRHEQFGGYGFHAAAYVVTAFTVSENSQDSHERLLVSAARFRNVADADDAACVPLSLELDLQQHASGYDASLILVRTADRHLGR